MKEKRKTQVSKKGGSGLFDITDFKLLPSAKPPLFHGSTVRKTVTDNLWRKKLRPIILEQQGKRCSICNWTPENDAEVKYLHLHEIEEYDSVNKVCHLVDIQLICLKCHSFQHIARTKSVSTKEQWADLMDHFVKVNDCSYEIIYDFDLIILESLRAEGDKWKRPQLSSSDEMLELVNRPVRFTISPHIPLAEELTKQIEKKGLLFITA